MKTKTKYILFSLLVVGLILIDLVTKILCEGINVEIIPKFFMLYSVHNYGAGLGILSGKTALLIVLSILLLICFALYDVFYKRKTTVYVIGMSFIFAGAIGNLIDRIAFGYVRDFLYFNIKIMPYYFNVADALLTVGIILFVIDIIFLTKNDKKNDKNKKEKQSLDDKNLSENIDNGEIKE